MTANACWHARQSNVCAGAGSWLACARPACRITSMSMGHAGEVTPICTCTQAHKKSLAQQLLLRDPAKTGPLIGRDRLSALRATELARNGGRESPPSARGPGAAADGAPKLFRRVFGSGFRV